MTWIILALLSHLVFIPGLFDGFSLPKRVYVFGLGIAALIYAFRHRNRLPLFPWIGAYLLVSFIPIFWVANIPVFIERLALDVACFAVFWAVAVSRFKPDSYSLAVLFSIAVAVIVLMAEHFYPTSHGVMGNPAYSAFVSAQAATLPTTMIGLFPVFAALVLVVMATASRAAIAAAIIALFLIGVTRHIRFAVKVSTFLVLVTMILVMLYAGRSDLEQFRSRWIVWKNTAAMVSTPATWIFGIGRGQFEIQYPAYANHYEKDDQMLVSADHKRQFLLVWGHPHNEIINLALETGVLREALYWMILCSVLFVY